VQRTVTASVLIRRRVTAHLDGEDIILRCRTCRRDVITLKEHQGHNVTTYVALVPR